MSLKELFDKIPKYVIDAEKTSSELWTRRLLLKLKRERYVKILEETEGDSPRLCLHCGKSFDAEMMQTMITDMMHELDDLEGQVRKANIDYTEAEKRWRKERRSPGGDLYKKNPRRKQNE